ncbi:hypothetical protein [Brevundimonas sp.]|uniref:hypothetical protein n=1 Tax=Brevundimonas sp. TaxID=1871086 RepID=UPI002D4EFBDF|nr:hypothetical protein [Brevundimonas sp.]HYD26497.1 hypothetical protein [Brevundimonas sp.]
MLVILGLAAAPLLLACMQSPPPSAQVRDGKRPIVGDDLRHFVSGRQIGWTEPEHITNTPHSHRYFADGRVEDLGPGARVGTWVVRGDRVCRRYGQVAPYEICDQYYSDRGGRFYMRNRWTAEMGAQPFYEVYVTDITN